MIKVSQEDLIRAYFTGLCLASLSIWYSFFYFDSSWDLSQHFFLTSLSVYCLWVLYWTYDNPRVLGPKDFSEHLLLHSGFFMGMAFEYEAPSWCFFTCIPLTLAYIYGLNKKVSQLASLSSAGVVFVLALLKDKLELSHVIPVYSFLGLSYFFILYLNSSSKSRLAFAMKYASRKQKTRSLLDQGEKSFFYDCIYQLQSLMLKVDQKLVLQGKLHESEALEVYRGLNILKSMFKDYYGRNHEFLTTTYETITIEEFKTLVVPSLTLNKNVVWHLKVNADMSTTVNFPVLYRVVSNIIRFYEKDKKGELHFIVNQEAGGISLVVKSKVFTHVNNVNLGEDLTRIILEEDREEFSDEFKQRCLDSLNYLAESIHGRCSFHLENGYWVTQIFIPGVDNLGLFKKVA